MSRALLTHLDTPACPRCGAEVEGDGALCAECAARSREKYQRDRLGLDEPDLTEATAPRGNG